MMKVFTLTMGSIGIILAIAYFTSGEYVKTAVAVFCTIVQFCAFFQED